jgi:hypothetical protein
MSWDIVGSIGEAVSAIALLFVLVQVRHARAEMRRSVSQSRADVGRELWLARARSDQLAGVLSRSEVAFGSTSPEFVAALSERAAVTSEEASQTWAYMWAWWIYRAQVIAYASELRAGERVQFDNGLRIHYGRNGLERLWYQTVKPTLDPDAVRYVDAVLAVTSAGDPP